MIFARSDKKKTKSLKNQNFEKNFKRLKVGPKIVIPTTLQNFYFIEKLMSYWKSPTRNQYKV